jgi:hypothetical protein
MSGNQEHSENGGQSGVSIEELETVWLQRSRGVLVGQYASTDRVSIYGLELQRVTGSSSLYDVFQATEQDDGEEEITYIDTLDISQFASARSILNQIISYYPEEEEPPKEDVADGEDEPSPTFQ